MMKPKYFLYLLAPLTLFESYSELIDWPEGKFFTKPLLIILIACYYYNSAKGKWNAIHSIMMASFVFSWFGDIFLLLTPGNPGDVELMGIPKNKYFFLGGVASFWGTQLSFISAYRKAIGAEIKRKLNTYVYLPFVVFYILMMSLVLPALYSNPDKKTALIPVAIYAATLVSMAMVALSRYGKTNSKSFWFVFIGACTFVVSDSLIAINFLVLPHPMFGAGFLIMATFIPAEVMIAYGILKHFQTDSD